MCHRGLGGGKAVQPASVTAAAGVLGNCDEGTSAFLCSVRDVSTCGSCPEGEKMIDSTVPPGRGVGSQQTQKKRAGTTSLS